MRFLLLFVVAVAISACSPPPPNSPGASTAARPSGVPDPHSPYIENDPYSISIDVVTKVATRKAPYLDQFYGLFSKTHRNSDVSQVYVQWGGIYTARAWRYYNRASNDRGQSYDFQQVSRNVHACPDRCIYNETYNIFIPVADLKRGETEGIRFKIYARNGDDTIVELPASLIVQFNEKLAEARRLAAQKR